MFACPFLGAPALAQEAPADAEAQLLAPVIPEYPAEAGGLVADVTIVAEVGADGAITLLGEPVGPAVLHEAAIAAARRLVFTPARIGGVPVASRVPITFHFEPPVGDEVSAEVVVVADSVRDHDTHAVVTLGEQELARSSGQDVGESLSDVAGVTTSRGTSDATKPIIRGQYERRLLLLFDGVRHESQKWGLDHAPEIDPFAAGEIRVVKGAAGVRYGPDAIGGVVIVEPPPLPTEGIGGKAWLVGIDNGARGVGAARLEGAVAETGLAWRLEGNYGRGATLHTPDYLLGNTASESWNASGTLAWTRGDVALEASFRHFDFRGGVCFCANAETPDDFLAQLDRPEPIGADGWVQTYAIERPFQEVTHDLALARATVDLPRGASLKATYAFQWNHRREYEQARASVTGPQYDFTLRTHTLEVFVGHAEGRYGRFEHGGGLGATGSIQENVYAGLPLIPNFRAFQAGVYGWERAGTDRAAVEVGARYDHLARTAFLSPSAWERTFARGTLAPDECEVDDVAAACPDAYDAGSVSLGGIWAVLEDRLEARLDLSSASRFPNADELYLDGAAPTAPVYAIGDPRLGVETTWGASPTVGLRFPWAEMEASTYANFIDDYIYYAPALDADGDPVFDVTIQGAFPRYAYGAIDAWFYGADGGLTLGPDFAVQVVGRASIVRAREAGGGFLVMIPSDRASVTLRGVPPGVGPLRETFAEIGATTVFRQTRVDPDADFAPPPPGYTLITAAIGAELPVGRDTLTMGVEGENLANTRYREYTSLLRYYADEPGREIRARVGFTF